MKQNTIKLNNDELPTKLNLEGQKTGHEEVISTNRNKTKQNKNESASTLKEGAIDPQGEAV